MARIPDKTPINWKTMTQRGIKTAAMHGNHESWKLVSTVQVKIIWSNRRPPKKAGGCRRSRPILDQPNKSMSFAGDQPSFLPSSVFCRGKWSKIATSFDLGERILPLWVSNSQVWLCQSQNRSVVNPDLQMSVLLCKDASTKANRRRGENATKVHSAFAADYGSMTQNFGIRYNLQYEHAWSICFH